MFSMLWEFYISLLTDHIFQTERAGALGEREGERDPVGRHPRGDPLHRLSQKPAGEAERGGGDEVERCGGRENRK